MKDKVANQLVKYLEDRGVEYVFGLCGHTNIAVLSAIEKSKITFVNTRHEQVAAHAADGYARAKNQTAVVLSPPRTGPDQRGDGRRQRVARFRADGGDRRRYSHPLLRQASAPGSEHACGCRAVRDLPPVRQARLARGAARPVSGDPGEGLFAGGKRPSGAGAGGRADGHLLGRGGRGPVRTAAPQHQEAVAAVARRGDGDGHRQGLQPGQAPAAVRGRRRRAGERRSRVARLGRSFAGAGRLHADGQGRGAGRPSVRAGHDRVLGHQVHQRAVPHGRLDHGPWYAFLGGRLQLLVPGVHVQHAADQAHPHRHRSLRDRPQLPRRDRRGGGPEAGAGGAQSRGPQAAAGRHQTAAGRQGDRRQPGGIRRRQSGARAEQCLPDAAGAHPGRRARGAAAQRLHHHRRRLEQERRRPAIPGSRARHDPDARRLRDDGLRCSGGAGCQARPARSGGDLAGR